MSTHKQKYLNSIMGLKVLCIFLLFWWHSPYPSPSVDLGARTCEFLFVVSGFLVGYNYFYKDVPDTWSESFRYTLRKVCQFWPLHCMTMIAVCLMYTKPALTSRNVLIGFLNLTLFHSWFSVRDIRFSFNGASWFLSALIFCYFMSPFLLKLSKKVKTSIIMIVFAFTIRIFMEYGSGSTFDNLWYVVVHCYPLARCLEYFMGMLLVPIFMKTRSYLDQRNTVLWMSLIEIVSLIGVVYIMITMDKVFYRWSYIPFDMILVFIFSLEKGLLSKVLSCKPLKLISSIQFEFFILHQAVIFCLDKYVNMLTVGWLKRSVILFGITIILSVLYKRFLSKKLTEWMKKGMNSFFHFCEIDFSL